MGHEYLHVKWNPVKSTHLKRTRGESFEDVLRGRLIAVDKHESRQNQGVLLIDDKNYIWVIPFVVESDGIFLKTLFPSRSYTKRYRSGDYEA